MAPHPEPLFLRFEPGPLGLRFALHHVPPGAVRGLVVYVHPFAEEMNKSRRMAALQSRALAAAGFAVLQVDLLGCGDSAGDFGDATWARWVSDVAQACRWLRERSGAGAADAPLWLWGLRAGCLLAAEAAPLLGEPCNFLFWQAPTSGKPLLQQFLRLKAAGDLLGGQGKALMEQLRSDIAAGKGVEVAGYMLHPELCLGLERATLQPPVLLGGAAGQVVWLEVSPRAGAGLSPAALTAVGKWTAAGWSVEARPIEGPAFWQTVEIEEAPCLLAASTAASMSASASSAAPALLAATRQAA